MRVSELQARAEQWVWGRDLKQLPRWEAAGVTALRVGEAVVRDIARGQLNLRAMSLVYTTLLSLVPLLAVSFSVLKGFGVHNQIEPVMLNLLEPLGPQGVEITERVLGFVDNLRVGVLGALGLGLLIYTVVSLMQKIESAFNYTWQVRRARSFGQRFSEYLSVLMVGPVLVFSALGFTASVMRSAWVQQMTAYEPLGLAVELTAKLVPYLLIIAAFTFAYVFVPNTRVRLRSAFVGAVVAGVLWQTTGWVFASFIVGSTQYTAIYSVFATLILFMIWLYLTWLILLTGASIAFYHQNPNYLARERRSLALSPRMRERVALRLMRRVAGAYYAGRGGVGSEEVAAELNLPLDPVEDVVEALLGAGMLSQTGTEPPRLLPGRPPDETPIKALLDAVRSAREDDLVAPARLPAEPALDALEQALEEAADGALAGRTLKDLLVSADASGVEAQPPVERLGGD